MKYTILPLDTKDQDVLRDHKLFESWDILDKTSGFNISQYKKVYEGEVEDQGGDLKTLDHLFGVFNIHHPKDFRVIPSPSPMWSDWTGRTTTVTPSVG